MTKATLLNASKFGMTSGLVFVALCAIALTGCAQFEHSFGELWGPDSVSGIESGSDSQTSTGPNDRSNQSPNRETGKAPSANGARTFALGDTRADQPSY